MLPPLVTPAPLRVASNYLDASPSTDRDRLPDQSELVGASVDAEAGVLGLSGSVPVGGPKDEGVADEAWPGNVNSGLSCCLSPRAGLPLLGKGGDGLIAGGAADTFLALGCVAGPARADAFWAAAALAIALSAGLAAEPDDQFLGFKSDICTGAHVVFVQPSDRSHTIITIHNNNFACGTHLLILSVRRYSGPRCP